MVWYKKEHSWYCNESLEHKSTKSNTGNNTNEKPDIPEQGWAYK
jgi:hypothetical protein